MSAPAQKNARVVITRLGGPEVLQWIEDEVRFLLWDTCA